jgi:hypothetical protein
MEFTFYVRGVGAGAVIATTAAAATQRMLKPSSPVNYESNLTAQRDS